MNVVMCVSHMQRDCKLIEESAIIGLPSHYSICSSQFKYQLRNFWLKAHVLYEQLLSSVPYATLGPIHNSMFKFFVYGTVHQLLWSKIDFFLQFQPQKLFFKILVIQLRSANLV